MPAQKNQQAENKHKYLKQADLLEIIYYTDPLCCWSWIFEPEWRKLLTHFQNNVRWRYCMGGLLPGWKNYYDAINSVSKPLQMGPVWMHAAAVSGINIRHDIWAKDPPASSYPACIAVKCAQLQSEAAGEKYLFLLREACMMKGDNIAKKEVLINTAMLLSGDETITFDFDEFKNNLLETEGREAFRKDLQEVKYYGINRFPTLVIKSGENAKIITGYYKYETLIAIINGFAND